MPLCKRCDQFFHVTIFEYTKGIEYGEGSITDHYPHQLSLPTFLEAVDQKCFVCWRIFYNSFNCRAKVRRLLEKIAHATSSLESVAERSQPPPKRYVTSIFGSFNRIWPKFNKSFLHELKISHKSVSELWSDIEAVERQFKPEERDEMGRAKGSIVRVPREQLYMNTPLSISTASNQTFLNISTWIRRCEVEHARCTYFRSKASWYPSRLLDVGTQGNTTVRLVRGGQNIAQGQTYLTLSHRWGAYKVPTLSTKTITVWSEGLSIKALPKTFQDFITLAQFLQVRYVWIDSLCIIQEGDSGADWRSEGLTMDQVYRNSYCNISADWGSDKRGLFFQRDVRMLDKPRVDLRVKKEPNWDSIVTEEVQLVESEFWEDPVSESPLSTRGWVVQERWLSSRNVRFGPREVFFECNQHALCERFPENLPQVLSEGDNTLKAIFSESQIQNITSTVSVTAIPGTPIYNAWHEVLSRYSRCYLTFASDRLIAFAGISKFFQEIMGDKYIEGLWLRNLGYDMMWFRDLNMTTPVIEGHNDRISLFERDIPGQYRAPSFSWASTAVPIKPPSRLNSNLGFLVTVKCIKFRRSPNLPVEEITEDVFGPILSPSIEVMVVGSLRRMRLLPYFNGYQRELYVAPDNPDVGLKNLEDGSKNIPREIAAANLDFQILYDDIATWMSKKSLYYMPWQDHWDPRLEDSLIKHKNFTCLLLELVDSRMSRFRRIGRLFAEVKRLRDLYFAPQEGESTLPCAHYDSGTKQHTIYII